MRYKYSSACKRTDAIKAYIRFSNGSERHRDMYLGHDINKNPALCVGEFIEDSPSSSKMIYDPQRQTSLVSLAYHLSLIPDTIFCDLLLEEHPVALFIREHNLKEVVL
jgi:hypothetical protein